ncbi:Protein Y43C5B.3 [Aphelenchoides avenae]|nr:Protein Y43C5B.3 [Aphelenchus avenae]
MELIEPVREEELRVVEWDHLNLKMFYPMSLTGTWSVRIMLYPLAVVRSRLQLQKQTTVYRSSWDAFRSIARYEGVRGLYRGFWVTVPQIGASFIYSTIYERSRAFLQYDMGISSVAGISSLAGGAASFCSQAVFLPTDIICQHMMIYNYADKFISGSDRRIIEHLRNDPNPRGTLGWRTVKAVYKNDGLLGFYRLVSASEDGQVALCFRGAVASSFVYVPSCFIFWPVYYWSQDVLKVIHQGQSFLLLDQAISAIVGGAVSSVGTNPMEVFRIRLQVHRTSYRETLERMLRNEGWSIFTKGLPPRVISNSTFSCVFMIGYEVVKRFCVLPEYKHAVKW